jgi:hypothetical protein
VIFQTIQPSTATAAEPHVTRLPATAALSSSQLAPGAGGVLGEHEVYSISVGFQSWWYSGSTKPPWLVIESPAASASQTRLTELLETIDAFAARRPNWDGFDGHAPSEESVRDAKFFLNSLSAELLPDQAFAPGDGEIAFQWRRGTLFLEIGFYGDDTISWFLRGAKGEDHGDDVYDRANPRIPERLSLAFSAIPSSPMAVLFIALRGQTA